MVLETPVDRARVRRPRLPSGDRARYFPALDGLRALAVAAVVAYHADLTWAKGGFLGVDVFFVLSGFLITGLLLADVDRYGHLRLRRFWRRRARRLLPAVGVLLGVVALLAPVLAPDQVHRLWGDLVAALAYVSNWRLIFQEQSYFEAIGRQPLLQHLWSLAVEEQFYLLWPLALAPLLKWVRRPRDLALWVLAMAAASTLLMVLLYEPAVDPSRVYYGTDTRVAAILVGAALACLRREWARRPQAIVATSSTNRALLEGAAAVSLVFLGWCVVNINQFDARLYRGGFFVVATAAAVVVAVGASRQQTVVGRVLGMRPLVWLGKRSYAVYLWFWPVFMVTRPHVDIDLSGNTLLAVRIGLTLLLASASYRFVEVPCRSGALGRVWGSWRGGTMPARTRRTVTGLAAGLAVMALGVAAVYEPPKPTSFEAAVGGPRARAADAGASTTAPGTPATDPPPADLAPLDTLAPPPEIEGKVTAIGDSVLLELQDALAARIVDLVVDADVARQTTTPLSEARTLRDAGQVGDQVILQVGNNGIVTKGQFDEFMEVFSDVRRVVVVNIRVPRPWEGPNNEVLSAGVDRHPNAVLVDWHKLGLTHPAVFESDGVHLTRTGVALLAQEIFAKL